MIETVKRFVLLFICVSCYSCKVIPDPYSLNDKVAQEVQEQLVDSVKVVPGELYAAGKFKRWWLGDHYRDTWTAPVKVPVLDFESLKQGLEIVDRGGGQQTYSLKLKGGDGKLYSLRSIQKDPSPTLPLPLQYSFADDIVQDQISASMPFGAFILPALGDAAGIYHTNPVLYYIPDTEYLGKYREEFGGVLAMLEEDADEDWSDYEDFGYTENAVSTESVMEDLKDDNENRIDAHNLLRVRLFDIWIGDWDRHEGQFRWATLEDSIGKVFRPIPEDRDNVFFKFDGFLPSIVNRKWAMRKFQNFDHDIRDIAGLNQNGAHLDRRFLSTLERHEWEQVASDLQKRLTDEVIGEAVKLLPDSAYAYTGQELQAKLKSRRDRLVEFANRYYLILAKQVDLVLSDNNEKVILKYESDKLNVSVYDASDDGDTKRLLFERQFLAQETEEVRIYGKGDEDYFEIEGQQQAPNIKVRIIGGEEQDFISGELNGSNRSKIVHVYDRITNTEISSSKNIKTHLEESLDVNRYDFEAFEYDYLGPAFFLGYNQDYGTYFGGGVRIRTHGFRKTPYASEHRIVANVAPASGAWNFDSYHDFKQVFGTLGFRIDASVRAPNFFTNFYGFGNETIVEEGRPDDYYNVDYSEVGLFPSLTVDFSGNSQLRFGPEYQYFSVKEGDNLLFDQENNFGAENQGSDHFLGAHFIADIMSIEDKNYPENGFRWITDISWLRNLNENSGVSNMNMELRGYFSLQEPTLITFASRIGGGSLVGNYRFYQANTIGGNAGFSRPGNVRGYLRDRFSGRSNLYNNNEVRIRLARLPFYYLPLAAGISFHFDQGRVWADGEDSSKWHRGAGGGIWIHPLGKWVFTGTYTFSDGEENQLMFSMGFQF